MDFKRPLFFSLLSVFAVGCSAPKKVQPLINAKLVPPSQSKEEKIPLPERTPFDDDPKARALYLENYIIGYRLGRSGGYAFRHGPNTKYRPAIESGYRAGHEAGSAAFDKSEGEEPNQSTQPAPSGVAEH